MKSDPGTVHLDIASRLDLLETVQTVLAQLTAIVGFSDDQNHYMSVAVRESVANAIKHGNQNDEDKRVTVDFTAVPGQITVEITDQGPGFDPDSVPDPLAPENLLKADGRGIFFMRQFMDEVSYAFPARGGTLVRMVKKA